MSRWRRLAPPHDDRWRPWLTYPRSLTRRIVERSRTFRVELLAQRMRFANDDEYRALGRPPHRLVLVREVLLHADDRAVVMAHSVVARRDVEGPWRSLVGLGTRPLAAVLFADPRVRRSDFEYARIDRRHALWKSACRLLGRELPAMWARRSLFRRNGRPLMVTELFLPELAELRR
jgi:chorismate--pyruvate lyase